MGCVEREITRTGDEPLEIKKVVVGQRDLKLIRHCRLSIDNQFGIIFNTIIKEVKALKHILSLLSRINIYHV